MPAVSGGRWSPWLSATGAGSRQRPVGLSRRAYARHRHVALSAVQKALQAGRISLLPDGTIDAAAADQSWNAAAETAAPPGADARKVVLPPRQFAAAEATV